MSAWSRVDGFHIAVGSSAVVVGGVRVVLHESSGWSLLLVGLGMFLLAIECVIANRIEFKIAGPPHVAALVGGGVCFWASALYLTRDANDLPHYVPGRDGDSPHLLLVPGIVALTIGIVVLVRVIAIARPTQSSD